MLAERLWPFSWREYAENRPVHEMKKPIFLFETFEITDQNSWALLGSWCHRKSREGNCRRKKRNVRARSSRSNLVQTASLDLRLGDAMQMERKWSARIEEIYLLGSIFFEKEGVFETKTL